MNMDTTPKSRFRRITGITLIILGGLTLLGSSVAKFAHVPSMVEEMARHGFDGNKLILVAVLELLSAVLLLMPITRSLGLLFLSSYLGGGIATHVQHNESPLSAVVLLALVWLGASLRHPQILWSLTPHAYRDARA